MIVTGILKGLALTLKEALTGKRITVQYPFEKREERPYRGKHAIDAKACIACGLCGVNCPNRAITLELKKGCEKSRDLSNYNYSVDMGKCIWCGICESVCPKKAIKLTDEFNMAEYERERMIVKVK